MYDWSATTFTAISVYVSWLQFKLIKPPNPPNIKGREFRDAISSEYAVVFVNFFPYVFLALLLWQSSLSLCGEQVGTDACQLHPSLRSGASLDTKLFTWNLWSVLVYTIIIPASLLRLRAFSDLGKDFTFELQKPQNLQTSGIYQYVQHPSYTGLLAVLAIAIPWNIQPGGIMAFVLPVWVLKGMATWHFPLLVGAYVFALAVTAVRLRDEEALLKEHFGKEWIEWHSRTARLIPFVF